MNWLKRQKLLLALVPTCGGPGEDPCNYAALLKLIGTVFNFILMISVPAATIAIVVAGGYLVLSGENEGRRNQAKEILRLTIWGLILVLAAYLIVQTLVNFFVKPEFVPDRF